MTSATSKGAGRPNVALKVVSSVLGAAGMLLVVGVLVWQAVAAHGNPDPTDESMGRWSQIMSSGVLVFREGLEAILVLATIAAGTARSGRRDFTRAVPLGAGIAFAATIVTWFLVIAIISHVNAPELSIQAGTGLLAIVVLLVVMNWFFHKVYWTGWIINLNEQREKLIKSTSENARRTFYGLALLGFAAVYREGFEVVLFLQDLRLKAGNPVVLEGAAIGLGLTLIVAALTFTAQTKLPYKKMLVVTGVLLGVVLLVMVGEEAQEMQLAGWISNTPIHIAIPDWYGVWFSIFPSVQTIAAQVAAAILVIGSYVSAQYVRNVVPARRAR